MVAAFGSRGALMATQRADVRGLTEKQRQHWHDVAVFAERWHNHLASLDTATRYAEARSDI